MNAAIHNFVRHVTVDKLHQATIAATGRQASLVQLDHIRTGLPEEISHALLYPALVSRRAGIMDGQSTDISRPIRHDAFLIKKSPQRFHFDISQRVLKHAVATRAGGDHPWLS